MNNTKPLFVTGIGTDVGKTVVSAILVEHLKADYWKPVQAGDLHNSDTMKVQALISNAESKFHPEVYRLNQPYSPHKAADLDKITIDPSQILLPATQNQLLVEGAGGLMVPLNDTFFIIDLIKQLNAEVALVSRNYLGSINHTLLSLLVLNQAGINIKTLIFNGLGDSYSESLIIKHAGDAIINRIEMTDSLTPEFIKQQAGKIKL